MYDQLYTDSRRRTADLLAPLSPDELTRQVPFVLVGSALPARDTELVETG